MAGRRDHTPKLWQGIVQKKKPNQKYKIHEAKVGFGAGSVDLSLA